MKWYKFGILLFLSCWTLISRSQQPAVVQEFMAHPDMRFASFGCLVEEIGTGATLCEYNADLQVTPASVLKLVTTATALELLGESYRFPTTVLYDGVLQDSILQGNIYIKGHGDPT